MTIRPATNASPTLDEAAMREEFEQAAIVITRFADGRTQLRAIGYGSDDPAEQLADQIAKLAHAVMTSHDAPSGPSAASECVPGCWYESRAWGRVLCIGTSSDEWLPAFAIRTNEGRSELRFLPPEEVLSESLQGWEETNERSN